MSFSMKKTYSEYVEYVKAMLGVVDDEDFSIEFDNSALTKYVKIAFTEVKPYINARHRITLPWNNGFNGAIDFKEHDMKVKSVSALLFDEKIIGLSETVPQGAESRGCRCALLAACL